MQRGRAGTFKVRLRPSMPHGLHPEPQIKNDVAVRRWGYRSL